jgi:circadian clock protein KaiB
MNTARQDFWELTLYTAGRTERSVAAAKNITRYCESHLPGAFSLQIVDLLKEPHLAESDQILAIPTLVRKRPTPIKKIVGDLSDEEKVLLGLEIKPKSVKNKK